MSPLELVLIAGGVGLGSAAVCRWGTRRAAKTGSAGETAQEVRVRVKGGFEPRRIVVESGRPIRLLFRREETWPGSECVVFPDLGRSASLPAFHEVPVDLPPIDPGEHEFSSEMGLLHGHLVVVCGGHTPPSRPRGAAAIPRPAAPGERSRR